MLKRGLLFIIVLLSLNSCKKQYTVPNINFGYNYFPLEVGRWIIYDVDSIVHNTVTGNIDTFYYQIKEVVDSSYTDLEGNTAYRIERYKRSNINVDSWFIKDVWNAYATTNHAIKIEENIRYIKLLFPVKEGDDWNGHAYNELYEADYEYTEVDITDTVNNLSFDSVAVIIQLEEENFIEYKLKQEKYARDIGLIEKKDIFLDYQTEGGYEYTEKFNSFGLQ